MPSSESADSVEYDAPAGLSELDQNVGSQLSSGSVSANLSMGLELLEEAKKDREQQRKQRKHLFITVLVIVVLSILCVGGLICWVALRPDGANVSDGVLIAFISASAVQSFALLSILVCLLFPTSSLLPSKKQLDKEE